MVEEREALRPVMHAAPPVPATRKSNAGNQPRPAAKVAKALGIDKSTVTRALARNRALASGANREKGPAGRVILRGLDCGNWVGDRSVGIENHARAADDKGWQLSSTEARQVRSATGVAATLRTAVLVTRMGLGGAS